MTARRLALLVLAPLVLAGPAHAEDFTVHLKTHENASVAGSALCFASAQTSVPGYVAEETSVRCRVDDTVVPAQAPGPKAVSAVAAPVGPSFVICVSGSASFVSTNGSRVSVTAAERCTAYDH